MDAGGNNSAHKGRRRSQRNNLGEENQEMERNCQMYGLRV